jgi:hypothetical protein
LASLSRCNRPACCASVPFHAIGIVKKKGIEAGIIETLAEVASGRDYDTFLGLGIAASRAAISRRCCSLCPPRNTIRCLADASMEM